MADPRSGRVWPGSGWTDLILGPGHRFTACDGFITNLHMPQSSELRLTSAVAGRELLLNLYQDIVVPERYLFNEFGDSMLIV
ncbi:S-adenosylmethionine:tRNA ribosyltransferase-isomerase [Streptacidiphilus sp. EB103A]|uniref:S-adenosylmethionine:tRNA ribosyltransferase-isomerase n=1 Tax=Streptacidiphilus sp. EB103A TaxID=3156275 RepID=UPI003517AC5F